MTLLSPFTPINIDAIMTTKKASNSEQAEHTEIPTITEESTGLGEIKINHSVIASIVRLSALEVEGTHSVGGGGFSEGLTELFKGKEASGGVRVAEDEAGNYLIEIRVVLRFGVELAKAAVAIQENVKAQITRMTMKGVAKVDVIIDGVKMENEPNSVSDEYDPGAD